jgi:subtilisin family serine protease
VPIKITEGNSGEASAFDIARAVFYATRVGCRAMNLSFAGDEPSTVERGALRHAITHGCVVVTAIGNRGFSFGTKPQYPAAYAADGLCIAVGASDQHDQRAVFSSYGPGLDVIAPGVDIWTTFMTYPSLAGASYPGYLSDAGTSFATPFVTGTVGLLAALRPDLDAGDFQSILRLSAHDVGVPGPDAETGWGRLDAQAALERVAADVAFWHGEAPVTEWRAAGTDTIALANDASPAAARLAARRTIARFEATATVAIPDSFAGAVAVWPRAAGTSTLPARLETAWTSWSEVTPRGARAVTLKGYLYRALDAEPDDSEAWLPVPPDQARLAFTVMGKTRRPPATEPAAPKSLAIRATPNPFRGEIALAGWPHATVGIFDLAGRRVRGLVLDGSGHARWDGRRDDGRPTGAGLYFLRLPSAPAVRIVRLP